MNQSENIIPIAFLLLSIFGLIFLYFLHRIFKIRRLKKSGHMVYGKIVDVSEIGYPDGPSYSAIIEYTTLNGQTICFKSNEGGPDKPTIGESVMVLYETKKPDEAIEFKTSSEKQATVFAAILGSILLIILSAILSQAS